MRAIESLKHLLRVMYFTNQAMNLAKALRGESHFLEGFTSVTTADLDRHLSIKPPQKIQQFVGREPAEVPVHQMRDIRLCNAQYVGDFAPFQLPVLQNFEDVISDLRPREKLIGLLETEIREDVAGAFFELNSLSLCRIHALVPVLPCIAS